MSGVNSFYRPMPYGYGRPMGYSSPMGSGYMPSPYSSPVDVSRYSNMDSLMNATGGISPAPFFALGSHIGVSRMWDMAKGAGSFVAKPFIPAAQAVGRFANTNFIEPARRGWSNLFGAGDDVAVTGTRTAAGGAKMATEQVAKGATGTTTATAAKGATATTTGTNWAGVANTALAGVGAGFAVYDGYKRFKEGDTVGGVANFAGMGAGALIGAGGAGGATLAGTLGGAAAGAGVAVNVVDGVRSIVNGDYVSGGLTLGGTAVGAAIGSVVPGIGTLIGGAIGGVVGKLAGGLFGGGKKKAAKKATKKLNENMNEAKGKAYEEGKRKAMELVQQGQLQMIDGAPPPGSDPKAIGKETEEELKNLGKLAAKGKKKQKKEIEEKATALFEKEASASYAQGFNEVMEGPVRQQQQMEQQAAIEHENAMIQEQAFQQEQAIRMEEEMRQQQLMMMQWDMMQQMANLQQQLNRPRMQAPMMTPQPIFMQQVNIYNNPFYNNSFGSFGSMV